MRPPQTMGFLGGTSGKESTCHCRRHRRCRFDPWLGRSPGGGHGNPLQYSCLGNPMDRGTWWAAVPRVTKSQTRLKPTSQTCDEHSGFTILFLCCMLGISTHCISWATATWAWTSSTTSTSTSHRPASLHRPTRSLMPWLTSKWSNPT